MDLNEGDLNNENDMNDMNDMIDDNDVMNPDDFDQLEKDYGQEVGLKSESGGSFIQPASNNFTNFDMVSGANEN